MCTSHAAVTFAKTLVAISVSANGISSVVVESSTSGSVHQEENSAASVRSTAFVQV